MFDQLCRIDSNKCDDAVPLISRYGTGRVVAGGMLGTAMSSVQMTGQTDYSLAAAVLRMHRYTRKNNNTL